MKEKIKTYFKENKKLFIGILIGVLVMGGIFYLYNQPKQKIGLEENSKKEVLKTTWYERNKETSDKVSSLFKEAEVLHDQGKSSDAIGKYKEILDLVEFHQAIIIDNIEDFNKFYGNFSNEEKKDKISEFIYFGNSTAQAYYNLSFAYRDAKDAPNNIQNAINAVKQAVEAIDKVILLDEIDKNIDPDRISLGEDLYPKRKASYLSMLGDLYRLHSAYDLAIKAHEQAIELDPENADYYVWYGLALFLNNQRSLGRQQWNKALQLDPNNADASKFLNQLPF